ncbi:hypothetical protein R6Q59_021193 [Mikania micrantha]
MCLHRRPDLMGQDTQAISYNRKTIQGAGSSPLIEAQTIVSSNGPGLLPMLTPQMSLTTTRLYHAGILPHKSPLNHTGIAIHPGSHVIFSTTAVYCYCCSSASAATILITWIKPLMTQITIEDQALLI